MFKTNKLFNIKPLKRLYYTITFFLFFSFALFGAKYNIDSLEVLVNVRENGSLDVVEKVIYNIDNINGIIEDIDYTGFGKIDLQNVYVEIDKNYPEKNGKLYKDENDRIFALAAHNDTNAFGTYQLSKEVTSDKKEILSARVYARSNNTKKMFMFMYNLSEGVTLYDDIAQLNRKFVGTKWDDIKNVKVRVKLPKKLKPDELRAFAHGPVTGNIDIIDNQEIVMDLQDYYTGDFVEGNIIFPRSVIKGNYSGKIYSGNGLDKILQMEQRLADETNRKRNIATALEALFLLGVVFWLIYMIACKIAGSRKHKVEAPYGKYFRELPDKYSPAVAGALIEKDIEPDDTQLFATVLELVRKKYLQMETISAKPPKTLLIRTNKDEEKGDLEEYETYVLDWYINELGNGKQVVLEDINNSIKKLSNAERFSNKYEKWQDMVSDQMFDYKLTFERYRPFIKKLAFPLGIGYIAAGFLMNNYGRYYLGNFSPFFMLYVLLGILLMVASKGKLRDSLIRAEAYARWDAFKNFLLDYSKLSEADLPAIHLWDHYFVYAVALGVSKQVAKEFEKVMKKLPQAQKEEISTYNPIIGSMFNDRYVYSNGFMPLQNATSPRMAYDTVNREIERRNAARTRSSSGSGFGGGGFSGGSSGGGGGGGGGRGF